jgi:hypothetical protein
MDFAMQNEGLDSSPRVHQLVLLNSKAVSHTGTAMIVTVAVT